MDRRRWVIRWLLGGLAWAWLGLGVGQAGVVPPVRADLTLDTSATVTVSLYQLDSTLPAATLLTLKSPSRCTTSGTAFFKDVTDCWLPEWNPVAGGKSVYVVVNGATDAPALVVPAASVSFPLAPGVANPFLVSLTTSAYPGQCTNIGSGTEADFTLGAAAQLQTSPTTSVVGYELRPNDCGGMAVIQVGNLKFVLPRSGTATVPANGIPEVWGTLYGGNLDPGADIDTGPVATSPCCDGISTFDEYRGFIASGKQIRTDPKQKNLFLRLVTAADSVASPSCGASCLGGGTTTYPAPTAPSATLTVPAAAGTPGAIATFTASAGVFSNAHVQGEIAGNAGGRARIVAFASPTSVTAEIIEPFSAASLASGAWTVSESLFAVVYTLVPPERVHFLQATEWIDRFTSVTPAQTLNITDFVTDRTVNANRVYGSVQKGMRVMVGLNVESPSTLGWAYGIGSPNEAGNVILFSQRIINYITTTLIGTAATLKYSTASLVNGAWTWSTPITLGSDGRNFILSKAFQFYAGMEVGHSLDLTPDVQGTNKTSYGHHIAPGTGDCLDQAITATFRSSTSTVTFSIPSQCGGADQSQAHIH